MTDIQDTLNERQKTHGSFSDNAHISQAIKLIVEHARASLTHVQAETLDLIATKLSRILSGNNMEAEHWLDIAGYAMLAVREIEDGNS
jgi:hypothetical protein